MLEDLLANGHRPPAVKICGLTNLDDARHAWRAGADLLGFVLVPGTPRYIEPAAAASLVRALREEGCASAMVGVLACEPPGHGAHRRARPTAAEPLHAHGRGRTLFGPPAAPVSIPPRGGEAERPSTGAHRRARPTDDKPLHGHGRGRTLFGPPAGTGVSPRGGEAEGASEGAHRRARPTVAVVAKGCGFDLLQLHGDPSPDVVAALGAPVLVARRVRGAIDWAALAAYGAWGYVLDGYDPHRLGGTGRGWDWALAADRPEGLGRVLVAGGLTPDTVADAIRLARPWGVDVSSGVEEAPGRKDPQRVTQFIERAKGV